MTKCSPNVLAVIAVLVLVLMWRLRNQDEYWYWILSAHDRLVVVLGADSKVLEATRLQQSLFVQPEGMSFDDKGNLFLSSEGHKGAGLLLVFEPLGGN